MNMDSQRVTLLVLLDLSAAFDTVEIDVSLNRLSTSFGSRGSALLWFASYAEFKGGGKGVGKQGALWEIGKWRILFAKRMNQGREKGHLF